MPPEWRSKPDKPPEEATGGWDRVTDTQLRAMLEVMLAHPFEDNPVAHSEFCARITSELLRRTLQQPSAEGESAAVH